MPAPIHFRSCIKSRKRTDMSDLKDLTDFLKPGGNAEVRLSPVEITVHVILLPSVRVASSIVCFLFDSYKYRAHSGTSELSRSGEERE